MKTIKDTKLTDTANITNFNIESYIPMEQDQDGMYFLNLMTTMHIPSDINPIFYETYTPYDHESFQIISYKKYGTVKLWWLICAANNIFDITNGAVVGIPIKIIKPEYVGTILNQLNQYN